MRDIIFRAKMVDDSEWKHGDLITVKRENLCGIKENSLLGLKHLCVSETVGEYTGLSDKNGRMIFEGDIVKAYDDIGDKEIEVKGKIVFNCGCFDIEDSEAGYLPLYAFGTEDVEIIGNIYDNPELLAEGAANA